MVKEYKCENCGKLFSQKGHFTNHKNRKRPCKKVVVEDEVIECKLQEKLIELVQNGDIVVTNQNLIPASKSTEIDMDTITKKEIPRPLLKWVGGKGQIIDTLLKRLPKEMNNYHELFVGGGSVLIMILWAKTRGMIQINGTINVYDLNEALIGTYNNIKCNKEELYDEINNIITEFDKCEVEGDVKRQPTSKEDALTSKESFYYWIRKLYNDQTDKTTTKSSAYFVFLNKTGFRGMYREGPNGYNIPYGNYKNPKIIDKKELYDMSERIQDVNFSQCDFSEGFKHITGEGDFVYLDPPYAPENKKSFVGYTKDGFGIEQHEALFEHTKNVAGNNMIMMSNANVPLLRDNLPVEEYNYEVVSCRRAINSKDPSAKTEEVIITNY